MLCDTINFCAAKTYEDLGDIIHASKVSVVSSKQGCELGRFLYRV